LHTRRDRGLKLLRAFVLNIDAGLGLEGGDVFVELDFVRVGERTERIVAGEVQWS